MYALQAARSVGIEVMYTVIQSLTRDGHKIIAAAAAAAAAAVSTFRLLAGWALK
jgi:hypothetical protein